MTARRGAERRGTGLSKVKSKLDFKRIFEIEKKKLKKRIARNVTYGKRETILAIQPTIPGSGRLGIFNGFMAFAMSPSFRRLFVNVLYVLAPRSFAHPLASLSATF